MPTRSFFKTLTILLLAFLFVIPQSFAALPELSADDSAMLNQIEKDSLQYFIRLSDKISGLTRDSSRAGSPGSIAATGFALASIAIGQSRGWIEPEMARAQIKKTLTFLVTKADHQNGFFYHFLDMRTGKRVWSSEASSIDTALLLAGALLAAQYYPDSEIESLVNMLYKRVNWQWMMNGSDFICMGWKPETGFLPYYWDSYNELMILQALAIGAPSNAVPAEAWRRWLRHEETYNEKRIVYASSGSLFTYQFAQAFIDFRKLEDEGVNYFENSKLATVANREYSLSLAPQNPSYKENSWGLSASLGPGGYKAYGGKPGEGLEDGTIAPYAAISSIIFTPELSIEAARYFYTAHKEKLYGNFGFKDAFNEDKNWFAQEYLGIDQGITVLMLENFLNEDAVWKKFMDLPAVRKWIELCDLGAQGTRAQEHK